MAGDNKQVGTLLTAIFGLGALWISVVTLDLTTSAPSLWLYIPATVITASAFILVAAIDRRSLRRARRTGEKPFDFYLNAMRALNRGLQRALLPEVWTEQRTEATTWPARLLQYLTPMARDRNDRNRLRARPWGWPVLSAALAIALAYPATFALAQYAATGASVGLAGIELVPQEVPRWYAIATVGGLAVSLSLITLASALSKGVSERLSTGLFVAGVLVAVLVTLGAFTFAFTFAGVGAGAFTFAGAFALALAFAGAFAFTFTFAGAFALAMAFAGAFEGAFTFTFAGAFAFTFAFTFAGAGAGAFALLVLAWTARSGRGIAGYLFMITAALLVGSFTIASFGDDFGVAQSLTLLVLLPLVNAIFDWLSYGLTLWLLFGALNRGGVAPFIASFLDVIAAFAMFFVLSLALSGVLAFVNAIAPAPVFDISSILEAVRTASGGQGWVIAMIASTLLPTLLHLGIGTFSLAAYLPKRFWRRHVLQLAAPGATPLLTLRVSFLLALYALACAILPVALFGGAFWLLWEHATDIRVLYVDVVVRVAPWL